MATRYGKRIVTDGLVLCLDAADNISAPHNDLPVKQGLVGWWDANDDSTITMNGSYVSELRDKSGNGYHMTPSGATLNQGPLRNTTLNSKKVLYFNSNGRGLGTASGDLNLTSTNYTVIALSRYTNAGGSYDNRVVQAVGNNWLLGHHGSYIKRYYANGWVSSNSTAGDNNFHTYVGTGDISNDFYNFWVDSGNVTGNAGGSQGPNGLSVNAGYDTSEASECELAELIVFNRVISNDERKKIETYISNKWNRYLSDAKWYDRTASGLNGSFNGQPIYSETNKGYFYTDGTDDYISTSDSSILDISGDKSLAIWVYLGADSGGCGFAGKAHSTEKGMALAYGWNSQGFQNIAWNSLNSPQLSKDTNRDVQKWIYLVGTQDGSTRYVYAVDDQGTRSASGTGGTSTWVNQHGLIIGRVASGSAVPSGTRFGSVSVYNKALSSAEILQNYNATKGRYL